MLFNATDANLLSIMTCCKNFIRDSRSKSSGSSPTARTSSRSSVNSGLVARMRSTLLTREAVVSCAEPSLKTQRPHASMPKFVAKLIKSLYRALQVLQSRTVVVVLKNVSIYLSYTRRLSGRNFTTSQSSAAAYS